MRRRSLRIAFLLLVVLLGTLPACQHSRAADSVQIVNGAGKSIPVAVELAITPEARQLGLMYRERLDPGNGMLFVFPQVSEQSFWMRNTKIPLDLLFIDEGGKIVRIHARATPYSEASLPSNAPVRYVLEVPGGYCADNGIHEGDTVHVGALPMAQVR